MSNWNLSDIDQALGLDGLLPQGPEGWQAVGVSIDSRSIEAGMLFVCIVGDATDGHKYIQGALDRGAVGIVAHADYELGPEVLETMSEKGAQLFPVEDGTLALGQLAAYHRGRLQGRVLGVTGSSGKTSAKEMLYSLCVELSGPGRVTATQGNLNNHWGMPLSLLAAREDDAYVILEMGMNHAGEISYLSKIARPHGALVTSISGAHQEFFPEGLIGIARAKLEILDGLEADGVLVYNGEAVGADLALERCRARGLGLDLFVLGESATAGPEGIGFTYETKRIRNSFYFSQVMAWNLRGAMGLVDAMVGIHSSAWPGFAKNVKPLTPRRFQVFRKTSADGSLRLLVDDSYNANQDSFTKAIEALRILMPEGRLGLFAGEMGELGPEAGPAHEAVAQAAASYNFTTVAACGGEMARTLRDEFTKARPGANVFLRSDATSLLELIRSEGLMENLDAVLIKGSRAARMDIVSDGLKEEGYV